jgi:hypothetical protein
MCPRRLRVELADVRTLGVDPEEPEGFAAVADLDVNDRFGSPDRPSDQWEPERFERLARLGRIEPDAVHELLSRLGERHGGDREQRHLERFVTSRSRVYR